MCVLEKGKGYVVFESSGKKLEKFKNGQDTIILWRLL